MKERTYGRMAVIAFFLIVIPVSAVFEMGICDGGPDWLYLALMWTPAVAALAASCVSIRERGERITIPKLFAVEGFHRCALRYVLLGCLLPLVYLIVFKYIPMAGVQIAFRQYSARLGIWRA